MQVKDNSLKMNQIVEQGILERNHREHCNPLIKKVGWNKNNYSFFLRNPKKED